MNEAKKKRLEAAGFVVGDFDDFATEVLGLTPEEARDVRFRSDLARAIRDLRKSKNLTQGSFGKVVGLTQPKVARMEKAAPEVSLDMMVHAYHAAGGEIRYGFKAAAPATAARPATAAKAAAPAKVAKPAGPATDATALGGMKVAKAAPGHRKKVKAKVTEG